MKFEPRVPATTQDNLLFPPHSLVYFDTTDAILAKSI
jgi:hypothetical protein